MSLRLAGNDLEVEAFSHSFHMFTPPKNRRTGGAGCIRLFSRFSLNFPSAFYSLFMLLTWDLQPFQSPQVEFPW